MLVDVVHTGAGGLSQLTLVGQSGQLFEPTADGWQRVAAGGVAGDVDGTARGKDGTIYVIGGRAPVYAWKDGAWQVHSLGPRYASRSHTLTGEPIIVVGRQLFAFDGDRFKRFGRVPSRVDVVWASDKSKIYIANDLGVLQRGNGRTWSAISHPLVAPEVIDRMVGVPGRALYAISDAGTILSVGTADAKPLAVPAALQGWAITAACADRRHVYLVGRATNADGTARQVVASVAAATITVEGDAPALADGDRYSLCVADASGELLVGSWRGRVHVRAGDKSAWTERKVVTAPPPAPMTAARTGRKPAHTP